MFNDILDIDLQIPARKGASDAVTMTSIAHPHRNEGQESSGRDVRGKAQPFLFSKTTQDTLFLASISRVFIPDEESIIRGAGTQI